MYPKEDNVAFNDMLHGLQLRLLSVKGIRSATEERISELKEDGRVLLKTLQQMQDSVMSEVEEEEALKSELKTRKLGGLEAWVKVTEETKGEVLC